MDKLYEISFIFNKTNNSFFKTIREVDLETNLNFYKSIYDLHKHKELQKIIISKQELSYLEMKSTVFLFFDNSDIITMKYYLKDLSNDLDILVAINSFEKHLDFLNCNINIKNIPLLVEHINTFKSKKTKEVEESNYYITFNGRFLIEVEESICYDFLYSEDFDTNEQYMDYILNLLTVNVSDTSELNKPQEYKDDYVYICKYKYTSSLDKYSYGESHYWQSNEWYDLKEPENIIEIKEHYQRLFPNLKIDIVKEIVKETITTEKTLFKI